MSSNDQVRGPAVDESASLRCRCCGDAADLVERNHCRACWEAECIPPLGCSKEMV